MNNIKSATPKRPNKKIKIIDKLSLKIVEKITINTLWLWPTNTPLFRNLNIRSIKKLNESI